MSRLAKAGEPSVRLRPSRRSCTAPPSGARSAGSFDGNTLVLLPAVRRGTRCGDAVERERVRRITITGDAMARPLIEALQDREARTTSRRWSSSAHGGGVLAVVKEQFLELAAER